MQTSQSQKHLNHFGQRHFLPAGGALLLLLESLGQAEAAEEVAALGPLHLLSLWQVLQGVEAHRTLKRLQRLGGSVGAPLILCSRLPLLQGLQIGSQRRRITAKLVWLKKHHRRRKPFQCLLLHSPASAPAGPSLTPAV